MAWRAQGTGNFAHQRENVFFRPKEACFHSFSVERLHKHLITDVVSLIVHYMLEFLSS